MKGCGETLDGAVLMEASVAFTPSSRLSNVQPMRKVDNKECRQ